MDITVLGIDLAKKVFQLHGTNAEGRAVFKKKASRAELVRIIANLKPCLIAMEACGSSHFWAREFRRLGHEVRRETVCEDEQERRQRCRSHRGGSNTAKHEIFIDQRTGASGYSDAASVTGENDQTESGTDQPDPGDLSGVRGADS